MAWLTSAWLLTLLIGVLDLVELRLRCFVCVCRRLLFTVDLFRLIRMNDRFHCWSFAHSFVCLDVSFGLWKPFDGYLIFYLIDWLICLFWVFAFVVLERRWQRALKLTPIKIWLKNSIQLGRQIAIKIDTGIQIVSKMKWQFKTFEKKIIKWNNNNDCWPTM